MDALKALIWNEWRRQRMTVLIMTIVTLGLWGMMLAFSALKLFEGMRDNISLTCIICLFLLYSFANTDSFAGEFTKRTDKFLLSMPVSVGVIYICKYIFSLFVFLAMMTFAGLLMLPWISLTLGPSPWIALLVMVMFFVTVHSVTFFLTLIGRNNSGGILAIVVLPVSFLSGFPGYLMISMFFFNNDLKWAVFGIFLTLFVLYILFFGFGLYLWSRRISLGLAIVKPLILLTCLILFLPWISYIAVCIYTNINLNAAITEAEKNGIYFRLEKLIQPPKPELENAAMEIFKFKRMYDKFFYEVKNKEIKEKFPNSYSMFGNKIHWFHGNRNNVSIFPFKEKYSTAEFILNDPQMRKMNSVLENALKEKYCYFYVDPKRVSLEALSGVRTAAKFLTDRAFALRMLGTEKQFFSCLNGISKLIEFIENNPSETDGNFRMCLRNFKYRTAILAGLENENAIKYYEDFIREIDSLKISYPYSLYTLDDVIRHPERLVRKRLCFSDKIIHSPEIAVNALLSLNAGIVYAPRFKQGTIALLHWKIKEKKLFKKVENTSSFPEIKKEYEILLKKHKRIPDIIRFWGRDAVVGYFRNMTDLQGYKLCLALKIYCAKHGKFPGKLEELCPEILPKIPLVPITGKTFDYKKGYDTFKKTNSSSKLPVLGLNSHNCECEHMDDGFTLNGGYFSIVYSQSDMKEEGAK